MFIAVAYTPVELMKYALIAELQSEMEILNLRIVASLLSKCQIIKNEDTEEQQRKVPLGLR